MMDVFFEGRTSELIPGLFPQLWAMACEHGWEGVIQNLEKYAYTVEATDDLHDGLERALANMSSRGGLRAASSMVALLRHLTSSLQDTRRRHNSLRDKILSKLKNFTAGDGYCHNVDREHASQRALAIIGELYQEFPVLT